MNKLFYILFAMVCFASKTNAQTVDTLLCDYPDRDTTEAELLPYFGNNEYLETFLDSIGYPSANNANRIIGPDQVRYHIPIKFWVYRNNSGVGGPTLVQLQNYIDNLNRIYNIDNKTLIGFYMKCNIGFIDDDDHLVINNDTEAWWLIQNHKEKGSINIHIANELNDATGVHYRARLFGMDAIFLNRNTYTNPNLESTIAHEVGHYLELDHTHQYSSRGKCRKEAIKRNRTWPFLMFCPFGGGGGLNSQNISESTGDFLKDTPADHNLNSNISCNYIITGLTDPWGDHYDTPPAGSVPPDTRNIMSYNGLRGCRNVFSRLQIAVMLHSIERGKSKNNRDGWKDLKAEYDEYETDNDPLTARSILLGDVQERNFHQQYTSEDIFGNPVWSMCDIDWVRFIAPCNSMIEIFTSAIPGRVNANTRLTLFNTTFTQLAQNDNISTTNQFSSINWNFVSGQQYFIRIENMSPNTKGYYNLKVGNPFPNTLSISGNENLCPSGNYLVNGLPTGATVSWSAWPLNMVSFSCYNCPQPTITRVGDGAVTITATVSISICGTNFTKAISKQLYVGAPDHSNLLINSQYACAGNPVDLAVEFEDIGYCSLLTAGVTDVQWDIASPYPFQVDAYYSTLSCMEVNNSGRTINFSDGYGSYTVPIRVKVLNACGWSAWSTYFPIAVNDCGWGFKVSPNPSTGSMVVALNEASLKNKNAMSIREIQITDKLGNMVKKYQYGTSATSINLNIHDLKQDVYYIRVFNGKEWKSQSIIKK